MHPVQSHTPPGCSIARVFLAAASLFHASCLAFPDLVTCPLWSIPSQTIRFQHCLASAGVRPRMQRLAEGWGRSIEKTRGWVGCRMSLRATCVQRWLAEMSRGQTTNWGSWEAALKAEGWGRPGGKFTQKRGSNLAALCALWGVGC